MVMEIEREQPLTSIMQLTLQTHVYLYKPSPSNALFISNIDSLLSMQTFLVGHATTHLGRIYVFLNIASWSWYSCLLPLL